MTATPPVLFVYVSKQRCLYHRKDRSGTLAESVDTAVCAYGILVTNRVPLFVRYQ